MNWLYRLLRPLLFLLDAERAHGLVAIFLRASSWLRPGGRRVLGRSRTGRSASSVEAEPALAQTLWGLRFESPIGLAAGLDKGEVLAPALFRFGFGFVEIGSITPRPQPGNPRPRLFRLVAERALLNRMGFNNAGAQAVAARLARLPRQPGPVGINLGRNKDTPNERAAEDYVAGFRALAPLCDYAAINVSSPNTPGLRALQAAGELGRLVEAVARERDAFAAQPRGRRIPLLVKLSPDEPVGALAEIAQAAIAAGADGIIATNTTLSRAGVERDPRAMEAGGLSGAPLTRAALRACAQLYLRIGPGTPIIGAGGILTAQDAYDRIRAGASLLQIYTALIYSGPAAPMDLALGLRGLLERDGLTLAEAIGRDAEKFAQP